jgi:hypothetical protein
MRRFAGYWLVLQLLAIAAGIWAGQRLFDAMTG